MPKIKKEIDNNNEKNEPYLYTIQGEEILQDIPNVSSNNTEIFNSNKFKDVFDEVEDLMHHSLSDQIVSEVLSINNKELSLDSIENNWSDSKEIWDPKTKIKPFSNQGFYQKSTLIIID
ncbi:unnamed protein product [Brachionus calyciflorus]|uniref:Uncharacterized protein n=1 Tax=Brachionus calyciflorus TaxID=104777 RepID=A0A814KPU9_9BILA|nr:unnamed protein product [Brachionus calyciflorus]